MSTISQLSPSRYALLRKYLAGGASKLQSRNRLIITREPGERIPLSLSQEQIWLRDQNARDLPPFYNESITVRRNGPLNLTALELAIAEIVRRHEAWRTTIDVVAGAPVQVIHPASPVPLTVRDLAELPEADRETEALRIGAELLQQRFNLRDGPLVRFTLFKLSEQHYWLQLAAHQIVLDGVSAYQIFLPELAQLYESFSAGGTAELRDLPIQFSDFAIWNRRQFDSGAVLAQLQYWRECLAAPRSILNWPSDFSCSSGQTFRGVIYPYTLSTEISRTAKQMAQKANLTLFNVLMANFFALLHYYTAQKDLVIGTVTPAGRDSSEAQHLLGYMLNPVALRLDVSDDPTFAQLMERVRRRMLEALANDDVPYEMIVKELAPETPPGRDPFFHVAASLEPSLSNVGTGWDLTPMDFQSGGSRWDLYFVWDERDAGISGRVQYNPDLVTFDIVSRMIKDFCAVIEVTARSLDRRLSDVAQEIRTCRA